MVEIPAFLFGAVNGCRSLFLMILKLLMGMFLEMDLVMMFFPTDRTRKIGDG